MIHHLLQEITGQTEQEQKYLERVEEEDFGQGTVGRVISYRVFFVGSIFEELYTNWDDEGFTFVSGEELPLEPDGVSRDVFASKGKPLSPLFY